MDCKHSEDDYCKKNNIMCIAGNPNCSDFEVEKEDKWGQFNNRIIYGLYSGVYDNITCKEFRELFKDEKPVI